MYYRLNVYAIRLPALRERLDDIPLLVDHFINICKSETGKELTRVADETLFLLQRYLWPGNVRELQGVIKNSVVNASTSVLTPDCLPANVRAGAELTDKLAGANIDKFSVRRLVQNLLEEGDANIYRQVLFAVDRVVLSEVLATVGNQSDAAIRLGISRTTLRTKLQALELSRKAEDS